MDQEAKQLRYSPEIKEFKERLLERLGNLSRDMERIAIALDDYLPDFPRTWLFCDEERNFRKRLLSRLDDLSKNVERIAMALEREPVFSRPPPDRFGADI